MKRQTQKMRIGDAINRNLSQPISALSFAVLRILFGGLMIWDVWRFFTHDRIARYYIQPEFFFTYAGFGWVKPLPEPYIHYAWFMVGVFAFMVMIGLFYRAAIIAFTVLFTYFFLLDKAQYLNHFYMIILYAALLCVAPANRALSVDARIWPSLRSENIPYWPVFALRAQTEIILIYAGLVKMTEDWLKLQPLGLWLQEQANEVSFGWLFYQDWALAIGAYGTIALHLIGAPLLLFKRTRVPTFLIYSVFHMANAYFFNIGVFPWLTIAVTLIFFDPDWPRQFWRWLTGAGNVAPKSASAASSPMPMSGVLKAALCVWLVLQIAIPLRFAAFSSEVRWSGDGHRFAWRMRMYSREDEGHFEVRDAATGHTWRVEPTDSLTSRQANTMLTRPDIILQFAHHLRDVWKNKGHDNVAVHAHVQMSLNGRPMQALIRPDVNLAAEMLNVTAPDAWVTQLTTPLTRS
ncbi:MAG: HTTM domain-containing protein [Chitinophagales bacterium]|nr:HTTM domain-containing protein [Hyphomicrobiales bacterium]